MTPRNFFLFEVYEFKNNPTNIENYRTSTFYIKLGTHVFKEAFKLAMSFSVVTISKKLCALMGEVSRFCKSLFVTFHALGKRWTLHRTVWNSPHIDEFWTKRTFFNLGVYRNWLCWCKQTPLDLTIPNPAQSERTQHNSTHRDPT